MTVPGTVTAVAERDGEFWSIRVPDVDRTTQARTLDDVEPMTRDLVAVMRGEGWRSLPLDVTIRFPAAT